MSGIVTQLREYSPYQYGEDGTLYGKLGNPCSGAADAIEELVEALIHADMKIRSLPNTDQSDVEFIRKALAKVRQ